eukprot:gb/GFBE01037052.1/.p1 GENE.gb/GFBE01037052.1/~~gb/GFBE01037052.1/.p1  ORF type:complete len:267 (+),score=72.89 gb/GFBE01037052.1/:1-801(+)
MFGAPSQGFSMGLTQGEGQEAKKQRVEEKSSCLAVTIRAIENAIAQSAGDGGEFKIYGEEPGMLVLVAAVDEVSKHPNTMELMLNDGTGRLKARYFITDASNTSAMDAIAPGMYVSVFGGVRTAPMNHFAVTGIRPVQSADEVSYHTIEVAHTYLKCQKGHPEPFTPSPKKSSPLAAVEATTGAVEAKLTPSKAEEAAPVGEQLKAALTEFLQKESPARGDVGVPIAEICKKYVSNTEEQVRSMLTQLVEGGDVFTTIDDNHFCML